MDAERVGDGGGSDYLVDQDNPITTFLSGPSAGSNVLPVTITFAANEPATFECQFDNIGQFLSCDSPFELPAVAVGRHNLFVRATDRIGLRESTAKLFSWTQLAPPSPILSSILTVTRVDLAARDGDYGYARPQIEARPSGDHSVLQLAQ